MAKNDHSNTLLDNIIRPLCIKLHQMIRYVRCFHSNKTKSFKVNDDNLLKRISSFTQFHGYRI